MCFTRRGRGRSRLLQVRFAAAAQGSLCEGFQTPAVNEHSPTDAAGVWKPPRDETAGRGTYEAVPRTQLWGFERGRATAESAARVSRALRLTMQVGAEASSDLRAGMSVKTGAAVPW
jgi:hypothetical protein